MQSLPPGSPRLADGRFVVVGRQRRGSISTSWRAFDQELGDWRTLRVVDSNVATREDAQRFTVIARELVHVDHPNVVQALEVGSLRGGVPFLVTEYVPGSTLARGLARNGALNPRSAVLLLIEITDALIALHERGLVHREIAAEHVLVAPNGAARLTDFDLAVREGEFSRRLAGVAAYRSPEQLAAEADPSRAPGDVRTDVFAVGVLLWTLLHGEIPRAIQRVHSDPNVLAEVDPLLAPILAQCLGYHPEDRYPNMVALSEDLLLAIGELPEEDEPNLIAPPEEQAVTQGVSELARVADSSTDTSPAWLEERQIAEPVTHNTPGSGKTFSSGSPPPRATTSGPTGATPSGKWFDSPPSVPSGATPGLQKGTPSGKPALRVPERVPTPRPAEQVVIGARSPEPEPEPEPTWLDRSLVPIVLSASGLALCAIVTAVMLGLGMVRVDDARVEAEGAQVRFLKLLDAQRRAVEQSVNEGAPAELEQRYLEYTQQRTDAGRVRSGVAFVATVEKLGFAGAPTETTGQEAIAGRQLVVARDRVADTQAEWRAASSSLLGGLAVGVGLAEGYEE